MHRSLVTPGLVALVLCVGAPRATAETVNCTPIAAVPTVISTPGSYCFTKALTTSVTTGFAIDIQANNVVIDMNGFRLAGLGAGIGTGTIGIHADNRQNITVRNGTIRGFFGGLVLEDDGNSLGHLVEDVRADQNTYIGLTVAGTGNIVRNCQVVATGGTTQTLPDPHIPGIVVFGDGNRVLNNDVISVFPTQGAPAVGIGIVNGTGNVVVNNRISTADVGVLFDSATGKYRDNMTTGVTTAYDGGTDAGNNN